MESSKGGSREPVPAIFIRRLSLLRHRAVSAQLPPHFTLFLGNIHKSQNPGPSLSEHFPGRVTRSVEEPGADMCLMCLNVEGARGLRHRIAHCTALGGFWTNY